MCWKENGNLKMKSALWQKNGGDEEDRTLDLTDANRTLSQLSYAPENQCISIIAIFQKKATPF